MMYIVKNALKSIIRTKGRNILIFILVLLIAVSACVALSVRNSAQTAKKAAYNSLSITAQITANRQGIMGSIGGQRPSGDSFDPDSMMGQLSKSLTLEELIYYSKSEYVDGFYYSSSVGVNVPEEFIIYENTSDGFGGSFGGGFGGGFGGMMGGRNRADLTVIGYSSHDAMTTFISGENIIYEGNVFSQDSTDATCVISYELAIMNDLEVGDSFTVINPSKEDETYTLTICGTFLNESSDTYANTVFMSYGSLSNIVAYSAENADVSENENGITTSSELRSSVSGTYVFTNPDRYESFLTDVDEMGLDMDAYAVSSNDIAEYERSIVPLESLSKFTMIFFIVVLVIGGGILVIFNVFTVRERKYEIGVLAAIGMKKGKVIIQFLTEAFIVTLVAILVGTGIGALISKPVGDYMLKEQVESAEASNQNTNQNFGGGFQGNMGGFRPGNMGGNVTSGGVGEKVDYVDTLNTTTDFKVLICLMGVALLLTLIASSVGMISVLRYEPLKILSDR